MFDIGWTEMTVIAVVAIVVVGPKELPGMLRTFGKTMGKVRRMSRDFQRQFDDALKEADLDEVRQGINAVKNANPTKALRDAVNPVTEELDEVARPQAPSERVSAKDLPRITTGAAATASPPARASEADGDTPRSIEIEPADTSAA